MKSIKETLVGVRKKFFASKIYITRSLNYISLANTGMISFMFMVTLKTRGLISFDLDKYFVPILLGGFSFFFILGYIEIKYLKGLQDEASQGFYLVPPQKEMKLKIDYIYDKMKLDEVREKNVN